MPKMDYLNAYCSLIMTGEEAEQFKSSAEILETEIDIGWGQGVGKYKWYTVQ